MGVLIFLWREKDKRFGSHWEVFGPLYFSLAGGLLMLADPTRHVLTDKGVVNWHMYKTGCDDETFKCLNTYGWLFTIGCTYVGIGLLVFGTMWNADIIGKCGEIRDKWNEIRAQQRAQ